MLELIAKVLTQCAFPLQLGRIVQYEICFIYSRVQVLQRYTTTRYLKCRIWKEFRQWLGFARNLICILKP